LVALGTGLLLANQEEKVAVPDLRGKRVDAAEKMLRERGLDSETKQHFSKDCTKGNVVKQSPKAGTEVDRGRTVELTVCQGPKQVTVPDVVGDHVDDARKTLENEGFKVEVRPLDSPETKGEVLRTDPKPNAEVA